MGYRGARDCDRFWVTVYPGTFLIVNARKEDVRKRKGRKESTGKEIQIALTGNNKRRVKKS